MNQIETNPGKWPSTPLLLLMIFCFSPLPPPYPFSKWLMKSDNILFLVKFPLIAVM